MAVARLMVILKWATFLTIVAFIGQLASIFLVGIVAAFVSPDSYNENLLLLISNITGMLITLPFAYFFGYSAVTEYLKGDASRYQKNIGINLAFGVILLATAIGGGIGYFMTGIFNISTGLLPLLLGLLAGRKAEAKFLKK